MTDWQKGDLALCTKIGSWRGVSSGINYGPGPRGGGVFTVTRVHHNVGALSLDGFDDSPPWCWSRFRKVTPPKADEFDREVIDLMNRKPVEA